jgi:ActR/RegA family two-component response regulator/tRNA A-37 threonylcarbamoyl transferase component Bud32
MNSSVLFVDDDLDILRGLMRCMRKQPFRFRTATSGEEALRILKEAPIDLVVSDLQLPGMSGTDLLGQVAHDYPNCVRIMLTGQPTLSAAMSAINEGEVYRFLNKPYDAEELAALICDKLDRRSEGDTLPANEGSTKSDSAAALRVNGAVTRMSAELFGNLGRPGYLFSVHHYDLDAVLGEGTMGVVVKGRDRVLRRDVAVKFMSPHSVDNAVARQRFSREGQCVAAIRHENVVSVFAVGEVDGVPYLVMEYVAGQSLQQLLDDGIRFPVSEIQRIGREIALGLNAAHELRLIHRDIKPANVLLEKSNHIVRITDFGLARETDCRLGLSQVGVLVGTPMYMSPEQVDGQPLTHATDIFSLGGVLYQLCTGRPPFNGESLSRMLRDIADEAPPPIRLLNPVVPERLAKVIEKMMAKSPGDRFGSAIEAAECLR